MKSAVCVSAWRGNRFVGRAVDRCEFAGFHAGRPTAPASMEVVVGASKVGRRTFLRGAVASTALATTACAVPGVAAAGPLVGGVLLGSLAATTATAFGTKAGENAADAIPDAFQWVLSRAKELAGSGQVLGGYVDVPIPRNQLYSAVTAVLPRRVDAGDDVRAATVQAINGEAALREVPAILQLGINWLVLQLAGYTGDLLAVDQDFSSAELDRQRTRNTIYAYELVEGSDSITQPGVFRALTVNGEKTIEVRWEPSIRHRTTHSRLSFRKGIVMEGREQQHWYKESVGEVAVPYRYIFEPDPEPGE